jgi:ankyrin repeat protein
MSTKKLRQAIKAGDAHTVSELFKSGVSTEVRLTAGWTPLQNAVKAGKENVLQAIIDAGADVNATNEMFRTALDVAIELQQNDIAKILRKNGARAGGELSFHGAIMTDDLNALRKHIRENRDMNAILDGVLPICLAFQYRKLEAAKILLRKQCDVKKRQKWNVTPLHVAASSGASLEILEKMLKLGAEIDAVNDAGETPLCEAAEGGHLEIVDWLLKHGTDVCQGRSHHATPVSCALRRDQTEIASRLIDLGAKATLWQAVKCSHLVKAREKLSTGADANNEHEDYCSDRPLELAVMNDSTEMVELLLEFGADSNQQDRIGHWRGEAYGGDTALHEAVRCASAKMVKLLLAHGADPDITDAHGLTPMEFAVRRNCSHLAKIMEAHLDKKLSLKATETGIEQLYTVKKVADTLSVDEEFVHNLIKTKAITSIKLDENTVRIPAGSLERYLLKMRLGP